MNTILRVLSHFDFHGKFGSERIDRVVEEEGEGEESDDPEGDESFPGAKSCSADCCDRDCECDDCLRCSDAGINEEDTLVFRAAAG